MTHPRLPVRRHTFVRSSASHASKGVHCICSAAFSDKGSIPLRCKNCAAKAAVSANPPQIRKPSRLSPHQRYGLSADVALRGNRYGTVEKINQHSFPFPVFLSFCNQFFPAFHIYAAVMPAERKSLAAECMIFISYPSFLTVWDTQIGLKERMYVRKIFGGAVKVKQNTFTPYQVVSVSAFQTPISSGVPIQRPVILSSARRAFPLTVHPVRSPKGSKCRNLPDFESRSAIAAAPLSAAKVFHAK